MHLDISTRRIARSSAGRPWTTIAIWIVLIVVSLVLFAALFAPTTQMSFSNNPDVMRADELLEAGDMDGVTVWKQIIKAIDELQVAEVPEGMEVH